MKKKGTRYILPILFIVIIIILISILYSSMLKGTLVLWLKNYNPSCSTINNTTLCEKYKISIIKIEIDDQRIADTHVLLSGESWTIELRLSSESHNLKIITSTVTIAIHDIQINANSKRCEQIPFYRENPSSPDAYNTNLCPH